MRRSYLILMVLIVAGLMPSACSQSSVSETDNSEPAQVVPVEGTDLNHVILTERAAQRLDVQTGPVREERSSRSDSMQRIVPSSAIIYDLNGETWVYVRNPGPDSLTFVRHLVIVDYIDGDTVFMTDGPPVGTEVATVAVAELYGIDTGVGK